MKSNVFGLKKVLSLVVVLVMTLTMLTGCGTKKRNYGTDTSSRTDQGSSSYRSSYTDQSSRSSGHSSFQWRRQIHRYCNAYPVQ